MMKRVISVVLMVALLFVLSGCSALFFDTYYSEKEFQGNQSIDLDADIQMVRNYAELRRLVFNSMNNHEETMQLRFVGYSGNAVADIAAVCNAIKTESAYGAYCVDVVSYDLTQIVSYYEATIGFTYRYTNEEMTSLKTTNNHESFSEILATELKNGTPKVVVRVNNGSSEYTVVSALIDKTVRENPLFFSYYPKYSVKIYSGNTSQKIYEVTIQYDEGLNNEERIKQISDKLGSILQNVNFGEESVNAVNIVNAFQKNCEFDILGGNTAYDALVLGTANSEGLAGAFKALCDKCNIDCIVVEGKCDREEHYWNIVKINDAYYHVDVSAVSEVSDNIFVRDEVQQIHYWWDQSVYPACNGEEFLGS